MTLDDITSATAGRRTFHAPFTLSGMYARLDGHYVAVLSYSVPRDHGTLTGALADIVNRSMRDLNARYLGNAPAIARHADGGLSDDRRALWDDEAVYYVTELDRLSNESVVLGYVTAGGDYFGDDGALARLTHARASAVVTGLTEAARRIRECLSHDAYLHDGQVVMHD